MSSYLILEPLTLIKSVTLSVTIRIGWHSRAQHRRCILRHLQRCPSFGAQLLTSGRVLLEKATEGEDATKPCAPEGGSRYAHKGGRGGFVSTHI